MSSQTDTPSDHESAPDATHAQTSDSFHLAHHFQTPQQQYASGKLGMWIFLATEILMFSGLFCAYAILRSYHPEAFHYAAHEYLSKVMGGINTVVLIASSFTMAWAVRAAQLNQRRLLSILLALTLLGGFGFMIIKGFEYASKWEHKALWVSAYLDYHDEGVIGTLGEESGTTALPPQAQVAPTDETAPEAAAQQAQPQDAAPAPAGGGPAAETTLIAPPAEPPGGLAETFQPTEDRYAGIEARDVGLFMSIYFLMTGLHGIHVLVGMGLITWLLVGALRGVYQKNYFTPVDLVGLYWHLVDLIWIFLFPLLYLLE